jgi:dTDP-4-amino-4,6-dideoxygalactose transaminase
MKNIPLVDLEAGFTPIRDKILEAIDGVLKGMNLYLGPNVQAFENEFASYCDTEYAIGVGSGTEAIQFALLACGVEPGDEVITSPNTFFATVEAIVAAGATPVFVDIDPSIYTMDARLIEKKITGRTKAAIPVHMYGQSADMAPILEISKKHGFHVIEDACQAHGALYHGKKAGSLGDAGCFSFYFTKNLGGYRNHGHKSKFEHAVFGYNGRLDEIQAAILRIKLRHLEEWNAKRRERAEIYGKVLKGAPLTLPEEAPGRGHVYHLYVVRGAMRSALQEYLNKQGIGTGIHYKTPIHLQEAAKGFGYKQGDFPVAESACSEILSLPMYPELTEDSQTYIAGKIKEFYGV